MKKLLLGLFMLSGLLWANWQGYDPYGAAYPTYRNYDYYQSSNDCGYDACCDDTCRTGCCNDCCYNATIPVCSDFFILPYVGYATGNAIWTDEDYTTFGLFTQSLLCDCLYGFAQFDGYALNDGTWAYSIGGGIRADSNCFGIFGLNAFYDYREGDIKSFHQFGLGFELLSLPFCCLDLRSNFYFPVYGSKSSETTIYNNYQGNYSATCRTKEFAPCAMNLELGKSFCCCNFYFYQGIGPYFLAFCEEATAGVRGRAGVSYCGWLWAEVLVTHDSVYDTNVQGRFTLTIPFHFFSNCNPCCNSSPCFPSQMWMPVDRFDMIPLDCCCEYTWNW